MYSIGLTGGICSGKSTVARILQSMGAALIDADLLGHETYKVDTPCYSKLVQNFGVDIVRAEDREIDRKKLGSIVFSSPEKMNELKGIVWPEIRVLVARRLEEYKQAKQPLVILEAAVMIEAGWQDMVDTLWVVDVSEEVALQRLQQRNGLNREDALKRIAAQLTSEERRALADLVVENNNNSASSSSVSFPDSASIAPVIADSVGGTKSVDSTVEGGEFPLLLKQQVEAAFRAHVAPILAKLS